MLRYSKQTFFWGSFVTASDSLLTWSASVDLQLKQLNGIFSEFFFGIFVCHSHHNHWVNALLNWNALFVLTRCPSNKLSWLPAAGEKASLTFYIQRHTFQFRGAHFSNKNGTLFNLKRNTFQSENMWVVLDTLVNQCFWDLWFYKVSKWDTIRLASQWTSLVCFDSPEKCQISYVASFLGISNFKPLSSLRINGLNLTHSISLQ